MAHDELVGAVNPTPRSAFGETKSGCLTRLCDATRRDVIERRDDTYSTRLMIPEHLEASFPSLIRDEMTLRGRAQFPHQ